MARIPGVLCLVELNLCATFRCTDKEEYVLFLVFLVLQSRPDRPLNGPMLPHLFLEFQQEQ